MGTTTGIAWTTSTWNPIGGCSRVSRGCQGCYAERIAGRFSGPGQPYEGLAAMTDKGPRWTGQVRLEEHRLDQPLRWKSPRKIFVNSTSDLFHEKVEESWLDRIFAVMAICPQHVFQVLTKRPERMRDYLIFRRQERIERVERAAREIAEGMGRDADAAGEQARICASDDMPNLWIGVSAEDQQTANERLLLLIQTPGAVRFVSAEPLLGAITLKPMWEAFGAEAGLFDWVIVGGESGPGARPMHPEWVRQLRRECAEMGVPLFFKQWGSWAPKRMMNLKTTGLRGWGVVSLSGEFFEGATPWNGRDDDGSGEATMVRMSPRKAGNRLDGDVLEAWPDAT